MLSASSLPVSRKLVDWSGENQDAAVAVSSI